jgi:hypothetical protein
VVAASVAVHLVQRGFNVRLVTARGEERGGTWHEHGAKAAESTPLLESLAVLTESDTTRIDPRWLSEAGHSGLLIAVLGDLEDHDRPSLTRMRHSASGAMAVVLDVPAWAQSAAPGALATAQHTAWLGAHGWRAVAAGPQDPLAAVWQELGVAGRGGPDRSTTVAPEVAS